MYSNSNLPQVVSWLLVHISQLSFPLRSWFLFTMAPDQKELQGHAWLCHRYSATALSSDANRFQIRNICKATPKTFARPCWEHPLGRTHLQGHAGNIHLSDWLQIRKICKATLGYVTVIQQLRCQVTRTGSRSETFARPRQKHVQGHAGNIHLSDCIA